MPENEIAVRLPGIVISPVTAPEQFMVFEGHLLTDERLSLTGQIASYAGGRNRAVFQSNASLSILQVRLQFVERVKYEKLLSWRRRTLMFRDLKRRKRYGVFMDLEMSDYGWWAPDQRRDVEFQFVEVSFSEEV